MNNSPLILLQIVGANGPEAGAKMYAYAGGSTNPKLVYYDKDLTTPCPSPLIADALGVFPQFFLESGEYRFQYYDANDNLLATRDYISAVGDGSGGTALDYKLKVIQEDTVPHFLEYKIAPSSDSITQTVITNPTYGKQVQLSVRQDWMDAQLATVVENKLQSFPSDIGSFGGDIAYSRLTGYNLSTNKSITFFKLYENPNLKTLKDITLLLSGSTGSYGLVVYDTDNDSPLTATADLRYQAHISSYTSANPFDKVPNACDVVLKKYVWVGITFYFALSGIATYTNEGPFYFQQGLASLFNSPGSSVLSTVGMAYKFDQCSIVMPGLSITYLPFFTPSNYVPFSYYTEITLD